MKNNADKVITISEVKRNIKEWEEFLYANYPVFAGLVDYTKEKPSLLAVLLALEADGYYIEFE